MASDQNWPSVSGSAQSRTSPSVDAIVIPRCVLCSRFASEEGVAVHLVRPGLLLAVSAAEGVDRITDLDVDKAGVFEHLLPARTGQPTRDSASPQVDVT